MGQNGVRSPDEELQRELKSPIANPFNEFMSEYYKYDNIPNDQ
jgi:hypothetical protein